MGFKINLVGLQRTWVTPLLPFCHLQHTEPLSQAGSTTCLQLSLADIPWAWHPCCPGVSIFGGSSFTALHLASQRPLASLHDFKLAPWELLAGSLALSHIAWPQLLSITTSALCLSGLQSQYHKDGTAKLCCQIAAARLSLWTTVHQLLCADPGETLP